VLAVGYLAQTIGLSTIEPGRSAFLTGVSVVLVPLLGGLFLWERLGRWDVIGALLAWAGLASLTGWILHPGDRLAGGDAWTLACALAFAFHILWVGRFTHKHPTIRLTWIQIAVATVVLVVGTGVVEPDSVSEILGRGSGGLLRMSPAFLGIVAFTGVFATALTLILQIRMQRLTTASHTAVIFATEPVFAALLSYAVRSERPRPEEIVGAVMILSGILVVQLSRSRDESRLPAIQA
jgi:drug/metabolite transporter (DMT)-like permease